VPLFLLLLQLLLLLLLIPLELRYHRVKLSGQELLQLAQAPGKYCKLRLAHGGCTDGTCTDPSLFRYLKRGFVCDIVSAFKEANAIVVLEGLIAALWSA